MPGGARFLAATRIGRNVQRLSVKPPYTQECTVIYQQMRRNKPKINDVLPLTGRPRSSFLFYNNAYSILNTAYMRPLYAGPMV